MAGDSARDFARRQREKAARLERSAELWERGAQGEETTGAALDALRGRGWTTFHDVRWPGRQRANIDHIAVGPSGVFVIDSKNWSGDVRVVDDVLHQGSRRREREVAGAAEAALAVTHFLQGLPAIPVLCFVRPEPIEGWARDVLVCSTQNLTATLTAQPAVLGPESIRRVSTILERQLASALGPTPVPARRRVRATPTPGRARLARRSGRRGAVVWRLSVGLIGGLILLGIASSLLGSIGRSLRTGASGGGTGTPGSTSGGPTTFGETVRLPAASSHPALKVRADKFMRVATTMPELMRAEHQHLVGVRYSIHNDGNQLWGATSSNLQFSALASNGQHAPRGAYGAVPESTVFPAAFNLRPGKTERGFVVFSVPDGAKLVRVSVQMGFSTSDGVEWLIP